MFTVRFPNNWVQLTPFLLAKAKKFERAIAPHLFGLFRWAVHRNLVQGVPKIHDRPQHGKFDQRRKWYEDLRLKKDLQKTVWVTSHHVDQKLCMLEAKNGSCRIWLPHMVELELDFQKGRYPDASSVPGHPSFLKLVRRKGKSSLQGAS